jgi:hypothetical protein
MTHTPDTWVDAFEFATVVVAVAAIVCTWIIARSRS